MKKFLIAAAMGLIFAATNVFAANPIIAGETFYGRCPEQGETIWVKEAPEGLVLNDDGSIVWPVPADTPSGTYTFTCKIKEAGGNGKYLFPIDVIGITPVAETIIGTAGGVVAAGDVKLTIPDNTVPDGTPISINTLNTPFPLPFEGAVVTKTIALNPHGISFTSVPSGVPTITDLVEMMDYVEQIRAETNGVLLTITGLTDKNHSLITYQPTLAGVMDWTYVPSKVEEAADGTYTLTATITHFSIYTMLYEQQFTHSETWMHDMEWDSAMVRVEALQKAVEVLNTETDQKFTDYLYNAVTPEVLGGDKENMLAPLGIQDSSTSAFELQYQLKEVPEIEQNFWVEVVNTGYAVAGATVPITHYAVTLSPKHEITGEACSPDCGPSYMLDRYFGDPDMHEILRNFTTDPPNDGPYWHNGIDKFIHGPVQVHYTLDTYDDPAAKIQEIHDDLMSVSPEGGGDDDPFISPPCTANMVNAYGWLSKPCPLHYNTTQVHCTRGNTTEVCPIHHRIHELCNYVSGDFCDGNTEVTYGTEMCNVSGDLHDHIAWTWDAALEEFVPPLECQEPRRHGGYCEVHQKIGTHCTVGFPYYLCPIHRIYH